MTNPKRIMIIIGVLYFMPALCWASENTALIKVRQYNRVPNKSVVLKDIAEINVNDPVCMRLKDLDVTLAPKPGKKRRIMGSMVEAKIKSAEPAWYQKNKVVIPEFLIVERDYTEIPDSQIKKLYYAFLEKKSQGRAFRVRDITIRGNRKLALGTPQFFVDDRNIKDIEGRVAVNVYARISSEKNQKIYISGWVDLYDEVVCAQRDISRGELIDPNDVSLEKKNLSKMPGGVLLDTKDAEGSIAKSHIAKGESIRSHMIEQAPLVRKGDVVKIIAESGMLKIVTTGVSQESGVLGEQITVENARSKKKMTARVVDTGTVKVLF